MKIVIIGSGIAGLTLAALLQDHGFSVSISERDATLPTKGHGFLMHPDAMDILNILSMSHPEYEVPGQVIDKIFMRRPDNSLLQQTDLESWICMKRVDIIRYLSAFLKATDIHCNRTFSHFLYDGDHVIAAVFENGDVEYGDLFIGADGARSAVRRTLFGEVNFTPVEVKEIVGIVRHPQLVAEMPAKFTKYMSPDKGLAIGMIPCSAEELVWFMQFDVRLAAGYTDSPADIRRLTKALLHDFPANVQAVLEANNFDNNYIWYSTDFDLMPAFHKGNVMLIGDAAHVALPFTSAGTTNALVDAYKLSLYLRQTTDYEAAFKAFYQERSEKLREHIQLGRDIKNDFLKESKGNQVTIPLITNINEQNEPFHKNKIDLLYFTDPVCSTCWLVQPQMRKLALHYGKYYEIKYLMGGLLPSWENYTRGKIRNPQDAAQHWQEMAEQHKMPISPNVWFDSPLSSSFPPSIAIKAAQLQHKLKAFHFHRRIKELLFVESKNITDFDLLLTAAMQVGLDKDRLLEDMTQVAVLKFEEDLEYATKLNIKVLPTFIFTNDLSESVTLHGFQEYGALEKAILDLNPLAEKDDRIREPHELFQMFSSLTSHEFCYLSELTDIEGGKILHEMEQEGFIQKRHSHAGSIWKINQEVLTAVTA